MIYFFNNYCPRKFPCVATCVFRPTVIKKTKTKKLYVLRQIFIIGSIYNEML